MAARELHKTPAAISQQIKQLEQSLGFALFIRHARHIVVTEKGQELAGIVTRLIRDLQSKIRALQASDEELVLRISTTHSFALKWLVPRIHYFTEQFPEFDIRVESDDQIVNLEDDHCDIAVRYSPITSDENPLILYKEHLVIIYSPNLVHEGTKSKNESPLSLSKITKYPLLYEGTTENWLRLFKENNIANSPNHFSRGFSHSGILVQAAVAAQGMALAPYSIAYEDILMGRLKCLPCKLLPAKYCYQIFYNAEKKNMLKIKYFQKWISAEMEKMNKHFKNVFTNLNGK